MPTNDFETSIQEVTAIVSKYESLRNGENFFKNSDNLENLLEVIMKNNAPLYAYKAQKWGEIAMEAFTFLKDLKEELPETSDDDLLKVCEIVGILRRECQRQKQQNKTSEKKYIRWLEKLVELIVTFKKEDKPKSLKELLVVLAHLLREATKVEEQAILRKKLCETEVVDVIIQLPTDDLEQNDAGLHILSVICNEKGKGVETFTKAEDYIKLTTLESLKKREFHSEALHCMLMFAQKNSSQMVANRDNLKEFIKLLGDGKNQDSSVIELILRILDQFIENTDDKLVTQSESEGTFRSVLEKIKKDSTYPVLLLQMARKILRQLETESDAEVRQEGDSLDLDNGTEKHVMISYRHLQKDAAIKIRKYLENERFKVWFDENDSLMRENIFEGMASGVENSFALVACLSKEYAESDFCKQEFLYATERRTPILHCFVEARNRPQKGPVALLMAGTFHFDLYNKKLFIENMPKLCTKLEEKRALVPGSSRKRRVNARK